ncbi:hypothetical protein ACFU99_09000 [Streptomyces sp. NPDC057654]|uniref:hypothetical protein n=1 Tax=Streptomyces sp. NPDC057654 TaxID=3346196 RepID=UPI003695D48E
MILALRSGIRLVAMPFGDAIALDRAGLGIQRVSTDLVDLLRCLPTGTGEAPAALAEEIRQGLADGWLLAEEVS